MSLKMVQLLMVHDVFFTGGENHLRVACTELGGQEHSQNIFLALTHKLRVKFNQLTHLRLSFCVPKVF